MDLKYRYFKARNASIIALDRANLASREIRTLEIIQDIFSIEMLQSGGSVLDLGAGDQYLRPEFEKRDMRYTGLDIEDLDLEKDRIDSADNHYDLVVSYSVIEHLYNPQNFLSEILRVMKPGSAALIETPNWHYSFKNFYNDYTHVRPYCPDSLKSLMLNSGFSKVCAAPNLRCKPKFFYENKNSFRIAASLPFTGSASSIIPNFLKGRSIGMFVVGIKDNE